MRNIRVYLSSLIVAGAFVSLNEVPAHAQCAVPDTLTNGSPADATQVMANFNAIAGCANSLPAGSTNAVQTNAGSGAFGGVGPLTNGQIPIGSTGAAPQAATITAGTGVTITNGAGTITIAGTTNYTPPKLANFVWGNQPTGTTGADTTTGLVMYQPSLGNANNYGVLWLNAAYPTTPFTAVVGFRMSAPMMPYYDMGIVIGDSSGKIVFTGVDGGVADVGMPSNTYDLMWIREYLTNYATYSSSVSIALASGNTFFIAVKDDGTNLTGYAGADLNSMVQIYSVSRTAWLSSPSKIGISVNSQDAKATGLGGSATYFHSSFGN